MKEQKSQGIRLGISRVFSTSPGMALLFCGMKVVYGILPAVYVLLYAELIDNILAFYAGNIVLQSVLASAVPVLLVTLLQYCGSSLTAYFQLKCNLRVSHAEKLRFMKKCSRIPYTYVENNEFQDIMYSVSQGLERYIFGCLFYLLGLLELLLNMLSILLIILRYSWVSALVVLICFLPIVLVSMRSGKDDYAAFERYQAAERRMNSYEEVLISEKYVDDRNVFGFAGFFIDRWKRKFDEATDIYLGAQRKSFTYVKVTSILIEVILLAVVGVLIYMTSLGGVTVGVCTMLITQILSMSSSMTWNLSAYLHEIFSARSYMFSYTKFYEAEEMSERKETVDSVEIIEFRNVSFRYRGDLPYVLKNLSFRLEGEKTYALVGENGAGKTTIMKLLLGLYDSYEGSILINGKELRTLANLNHIFSAMFQDYARYELSVRDNLYLGSEADDKKALQLMKELKLELSQQLDKEGLDTQVGRLVGENRDFSGGQWQRLAMIRALVHPGSFFLLDEPTAALDPTAENAIYQDFRKLLQGRSALLITHRLGAARLSDHILVLQDGCLAEQGSHEELLRQQGIYALMFEGQKGWYGE